MKGKKPTWQERKILQKAGYDTYTWLVQKNSPEFLQIINKDTKEEVRIDKCGSQG